MALVEAVTIAVHLQDMDMVGETVQQGPGEAFGAEDFGRCCQSNANQSPNLQMMRISRRQLTPFGQRGGAIFFEGFAAVEMTFEIEMIVDRSMN